MTEAEWLELASILYAAYCVDYPGCPPLERMTSEHQQRWIMVAKAASMLFEDIEGVA